MLLIRGSSKGCADLRSLGSLAVIHLGSDSLFSSKPDQLQMQLCTQNRSSLQSLSLIPAFGTHEHYSTWKHRRQSHLHVSLVLCVQSVPSVVAC